MAREWLHLLAAGEHGAAELHRLYESAVQAPKGDIQYMLTFFRQYVGHHLPQHLVEHFCGTALLAATWCKGDVRRTAVGMDIDDQALRYGWEEHTSGLMDESGQGCARLQLLVGNVLDDMQAARPLLVPHGETKVRLSVQLRGCGTPLRHVQAPHIWWRAPFIASHARIAACHP